MFYQDDQASVHGQTDDRHDRTIVDYPSLSLNVDMPVSSPPAAPPEVRFVDDDEPDLTPLMIVAPVPKERKGSLALLGTPSPYKRRQSVHEEAFQKALAEEEQRSGALHSINAIVNAPLKLMDEVHYAAISTIPVTTLFADTPFPLPGTPNFRAVARRASLMADIPSNDVTPQNHSPALSAASATNVPSPSSALTSPMANMVHSKLIGQPSPASPTDGHRPSSAASTFSWSDAATPLTASLTPSAFMPAPSPFHLATSSAGGDSRGPLLPATVTTSSTSTSSVPVETGITLPDTPPAPSPSPAMAALQEAAAAIPNVRRYLDQKESGLIRYFADQDVPPAARPPPGGTDKHPSAVFLTPGREPYLSPEWKIKCGRLSDRSPGAFLIPSELEDVPAVKKAAREPIITDNPHPVKLPAMPAIKDGDHLDARTKHNREQLKHVPVAGDGTIVVRADGTRIPSRRTSSTAVAKIETAVQNHAHPRQPKPAHIVTDVEAKAAPTGKNCM
jgi:hypothetical protein